MHHSLVFLINYLDLHYQIVDTFVASQAQLCELESQATVGSFQTGPNDIIAQVFGSNRNVGTRDGIRSHNHRTCLQ